MTTLPIQPRHPNIDRREISMVSGNTCVAVMLQQNKYFRGFIVNAGKTRRQPFRHPHNDDAKFFIHLLCVAKNFTGAPP
jgi:hypothetical protein